MIYKLEPKLYDKIWGGDYFSKNYHYPASATSGEIWGISGYKNSSSIIINGEYKGKTLAEMYDEYPNLFGNHSSKEFPILVKIIEAKSDLSIQVHPNDEYAKKHHNSLGKTECWTILDAEENTTIIVGHNALTKEELVKKVESNNYDELVNKIPIKKGDTFDIPAGMIHAICNGTVILEVQQSSDVTYRFYDYGRLENGKPRELHLEKAIDVIQIPSGIITNTGDTEYFSYHIFNSFDETVIADIYGDYYFVINGTGNIGDIDVKKGDFLFVPSLEQYEISKGLELAKIKIK